MDYTRYHLEDFVLDHDFQRWVYQPNRESDQFWKRFLELYPEKKPLIENARQVLITIRLDQHALQDSELQKLKDSIHQEMHKVEEEIPHLEPSNGHLHNKRFGFGMKRVAALIGFLMVSMLLFWFLSQPKEIRYVTGFEETKTILLPDSSTVIMNANTVLSMLGDWEDKADRVVQLEGEAYFKVKEKPHLDHQKFIVSTENASIEVIGTEFNVNNRRQKMQVVLSSGKVKLSNRLLPNKEVTMEPGEMAALSTDQPEIIQQKVEPEKYISWMENKLILENTSLQAVAELLEDHYGFEVIIKDRAQGQRKFSATTTVPLDDVERLLDLIEKSFDVQVLKNGSQIIIRAQ